MTDSPQKILPSFVGRTAPHIKGACLATVGTRALRRHRRGHTWRPVPAAIVARELEIRLIETACISSYHGSDQGDLHVLKEAPSAGKGAGWLIVDDLVDTGETAKALRTMMPEAHFATVYAKPAGGRWSIRSLPKYHRIRGFSFPGTWSHSLQPRSSGNVVNGPGSRSYKQALFAG